jgi:hypothetical protein
MAARLIELETGKVWELFANPENYAGDWNGSPWWRYRINRFSWAAVRLTKPWISKHHGGVDFREGRWWANDGGSINTVTVNGVPIQAPRDQPIDDGDVLGFGQTRLRFETDGGPPVQP